VPVVRHLLRIVAVTLRVDVSSSLLPLA